MNAQQPGKGPIPSVVELALQNSAVTQRRRAWRWWKYTRLRLDGRGALNEHVFNSELHQPGGFHNG